MGRWVDMRISGHREEWVNSHPYISHPSVLAEVILEGEVTVAVNGGEEWVKYHLSF